MNFHSSNLKPNTDGSVCLQFASDFDELEKYLSATQSSSSPRGASVSWEYMDSLQRKYQTGKDNVGVLADADKDLHDRLGHCVNRKDSMTVRIVSSG